MQKKVLEKKRRKKKKKKKKKTGKRRLIIFMHSSVEVLKHPPGSATGVTGNVERSGCKRARFFKQ